MKGSSENLGVNMPAKKSTARNTRSAPRKGSAQKTNNTGEQRQDTVREVAYPVDPDRVRDMIETCKKQMSH